MSHEEGVASGARGVAEAQPRSQTERRHARREREGEGGIGETEDGDESAAGGEGGTSGETGGEGEARHAKRPGGKSRKRAAQAQGKH